MVQAHLYLIIFLYYFLDGLHLPHMDFSLALLVSVFWALPVHASARLATNDLFWLDSPYEVPDADARHRRENLFIYQRRWTPRVLGLSCYLVFATCAYQAWVNIPISAQEPIAVDIYRITSFDIWFFMFFFALIITYILAKDRHYYCQICISVHNTAKMAISLSMLAILFLPFLLTLFPRVWLLPLLLGVWVPLVNWLARFGYRHRISPFIIAGVIYLFIMLTGKELAPRLIDLDPNKPIVRQTLTEAIAQWKFVNCVADHCPSPIVALLSGGASRSGFFAASALGLLTDISCESSVTCKSSLFPKRLFAISSVSGGSVAAAVYDKALADGAVSGMPPCKPGRPSARYFRGDAPGWRGCMQKILAEDFLSPVIAGLAFRDVIGAVGAVLGSCAWPDRGLLIEAAIADAYLRYTGDIESGCAEDRRNGLDIPFSRLRSTASTMWLPILLFNSTEAISGRRFVFSSIAPEISEGGARWLRNANDFHSLLFDFDIRLVAAAHNSARFPIISPVGMIHEGSIDQDLTFALIDGGYFDNFGVPTALDITTALISQKLHPFILVILNNPSSGNVLENGDENGEDDYDAWVDTGPSLFPFAITAPLSGVISTSSVHSEIAMQELQNLTSMNKNENEKSDVVCNKFSASGGCTAVLAVYGFDGKGSLEGTRDNINNRLSAVSMSWWLSKPVQQYLDNQLDIHGISDGQRELVQHNFGVNEQNLLKTCEILEGNSNFESACKERVHALE
jgi:hypothetical protein